MITDIVKKQHLLPVRSISRFCDVSGNVMVMRNGSKSVFPVKSNNQIFCVNRLWDQKSEKSFGKEIEDKYQELVDKIIQENKYSICERNQLIITQFYALWKYRSELDEEQVFLPEQSALSSAVIEKKEKDYFDKLQTNYIDETGFLPMRNILGIRLFGYVSLFCRTYTGLFWNLVKSEQELIVSNSPTSELYLPITPNLCLLAGNPPVELSPKQTRYVNQRSIEQAKNFIFGRALKGYY